jgi:acyl-CoA synthetase (AMP-forming)/AMP-acid ligase II
MQEIADYVAKPFGFFADLVGLQARARPYHTAIICQERSIDYQAIDVLIDRVAASLQRDGVTSKGVVAICADNSIEYVGVFIGALRAGAAPAPLAPSAAPEQLLAMLQDCRPSHIFLDMATAERFAQVLPSALANQISMDESEGPCTFSNWLVPSAFKPSPVEIDPEQAFNIIYSSGTTGTPKGIVQSHRMRWPHNHLVDPPGYGPDAVAVISTPLYSNTTLVSLIPALAGGGTVVLMPKFEPRRFLELSERCRATHAMLAPVQYRRILDVDDFDRFDLSSYVMKFATSAPFAAELKAEVLQRWPGGLIEYYGMTEGGGSCMLVAHEHPDKLATVGKPMDGHDIRLIDEEGRELAAGEVGEVVGRSGSMMNGYHNRPESTAEATWMSSDGLRFIRTGDLAMRDEDGFFTLIGRKKDMIISGGANIFPVDLEAALLKHPGVREAAVVGVKSERWGETPVGFVTLNAEDKADAEAIRIFANAQLGKFQRLTEVRIVDELPRSPIGKILKRELQASFASEAPC